MTKQPRYSLTLNDGATTRTVTLPDAGGAFVVTADSLKCDSESLREVMVGDVASRIARSRLEWLEGVLAQLLAAGVPRSAIAVQDYPALRTIVTVHGEPRCQWNYTLTQRDADGVVVEQD